MISIYKEKKTRVSEKQINHLIIQNMLLRIVFKWIRFFKLLDLFVNILQWMIEVKEAQCFLILSWVISIQLVTPWFLFFFARSGIAVCIWAYLTYCNSDSDWTHSSFKYCWKLYLWNTFFLLEVKGSISMLGGEMKCTSSQRTNHTPRIYTGQSRVLNRLSRDIIVITNSLQTWR